MIKPNVFQLLSFFMMPKPLRGFGGWLASLAPPFFASTISGLGEEEKR
jgi:hypothetical protein